MEIPAPGEFTFGGPGNNSPRRGFPGKKKKPLPEVQVHGATEVEVWKGGPRPPQKGPPPFFTADGPRPPQGKKNTAVGRRQERGKGDAREPPGRWPANPKGPFDVREFPPQM